MKIVYQNLIDYARYSLRNFGRLTTLIVGMRNVGSNRTGPGTDRVFDFGKADPRFVEYAQTDLRPEKAREILERSGLVVSLDQARLVLEFLQQLADITATQYLRK